MSRRNFIFKVATELREDYVAERGVRRSASEQKSSETSEKNRKRKQCQVAANCKKIKL